MPDRRRGANLGDGRTRARATSRARATNVTYDEAYTYALRVAFLHHLLQPKRKRKEYVAAPRPPVRAHTSSVGDLMKEFLPRDSTTSADIRLPRGFRTALEARMEGVLRGTEKLPGYNDAAVKRSFAEAYTAFTDSSFRKTIDKERKIEPMALIFYSSATKALQRGRAPDDDSWKLLVDRHLALFLRLATSTLRDQGSDKPELVNRLTTLENKLLVNDQNLYIDSSQDAGGATVEVVVPLSYDVKDMPMVQDVARIFGLTLAQVQAHLDNNRQIWTEEAALKDLKSYQHRLNTNLPGALRSQDFDIEDAFEEWKKSEAPHLSHMMMEILIAKPELAATSSHGLDKALPAGPPSTYGEDQAYSELSRVLASGSVDPGAMFGYDPALNFGALSISDNSSIKLVDEVNYTFIPPDPRAYYKAIVKYAMDFDHMHGDPSAAYAPLSKASTELLTEICVRWRIPQVTRLVAFLEVASKKFLDREIEPTELDVCIELVQDPQPEPKKAPAIHMHTANVSQIPVSRWTLQDIAGYRQCLYSVHDALLRDLYGMLLKCYEPKPPSIGVVMHILEAHIYSDPSFSRKEEDAAAYAELLRDGLRNEATEVYRHYLDEEIPRSQEDWDFGHVVKLGQSVVKLCDRIRKRYSKNPEIMGVNPLTILVETMFPNFEKDAEDIIKRVVDVAKSKGTEIDLQDGFDLYRELVQIRRIHLSSLPAQPFAFDIENALVDFVWRWIRNAEEKMENFVDEAIKQDQFQVRTHRPDDIPTDEQRHSVSVMDIFQLFNQTANQIFDLNWDNDIHHAKFMTSLARTFAAGIGRYCEVVEQRFAKEMDRPTAEELAAAQKTTQEKFFQYAKDAWNTKEKVQPFQFYPEVSRGQVSAVMPHGSSS